MHIPSNIQSKLTNSYEGVPSARFHSSLAAKRFEEELEQAQLSYRSRIVKSKKEGTSIVVMVLGTPQWH
jgi:hypothetical protein